MTSFAISARAVSIALARIMMPSQPTVVVAETWTPKIRRVILDAFQTAREEVVIQDLVDVLSLGHSGTGAPLHVLEGVLQLLETELLGTKLRTALRTAKTGENLKSVLHGTLKAGAQSKELCVIETDRVARAKANANPARKEWQDRGEANEPRIARMVGGKSLDDNEPFDVLVKFGSKQHGIEVKTFVDNKSSKITMNKEALSNKARWKRQNKAAVHTVVVDDRDLFNRTLYSGHKVYYRKGVGSFRLESMTRVEDAQHLRRLMQGLK